MAEAIRLTVEAHLGWKISMWSTGLGVGAAWGTAGGEAKQVMKVCALVHTPLTSPETPAYGWNASGTTSWEALCGRGLGSGGLGGRGGQLGAGQTLCSTMRSHAHSSAFRKVSADDSTLPTYHWRTNASFKQRELHVRNRCLGPRGGSFDQRLRLRRLRTFHSRMPLACPRYL